MNQLSNIKIPASPTQRRVETRQKKKNGIVIRNTYEILS